MNTWAHETSLITFHDLSSVLCPLFGPCLTVLIFKRYDFLNVDHLILTIPFQTKRIPGVLLHRYELESTRSDESLSVLNNREERVRDDSQDSVLVSCVASASINFLAELWNMAGGEVLGGECRGR